MELSSQDNLGFWASYRNLVPLGFLLGGFTVDLITHLAKGETLEYFLFGPQGIFAWNHFLLPVGAIALTLNVAVDLHGRRRSVGIRKLR